MEKQGKGKNGIPPFEDYQPLSDVNFASHLATDTGTQSSDRRAITAAASDR